VEPNPRTARIHEAIKRGLAATHIEVIDHSAEHAGHPGAANGGGHFQVIVVSERFDGLSRVAAQRLVYEALGELMTADIHALSMLTMTPEQWQARSDQGSR
jgi:BolA protein